MTDYPHCKTCDALCHRENMVQWECVPCTRKTIDRLKDELREVENQGNLFGSGETIDVKFRIIGATIEDRKND